MTIFAAMIHIWEYYWKHVIIYPFINESIKYLLNSDVGYYLEKPLESAFFVTEVEWSGRDNTTFVRLYSLNSCEFAVPVYKTPNETSV